MWAVRGILCLMVLLTLTVYSFQYTTLSPPSGDPNTLSGCQSTFLVGENLDLSLKNNYCYGPNRVTLYNWTLLTSPDGVRQQIGTCFGCENSLCSTTMNNDAFSVQDNHALVIRNMTQKFSGWEVRAQAYNQDGRLVLSQHCLLNVGLVKMSDTSVLWHNMQQRQSEDHLGTCETSTSSKEGDQLKWMLRPAYGLSDTDRHEYTLGTCTYRTPPGPAGGGNDHFLSDNTVYRDGYNVSGDFGVRSRTECYSGGSWLYLTVNASSSLVSEMQGSLICQYTSGGMTSFDSRPIKLYRPATVDNCYVNVQKQSAILSCDVSNVYSSDRNFTFSVVAMFKYSSQYDSKGTSSEFTLFTGSYEDELTSYTNSDGVLVYRGRLEYSWSLGRCVGAYHKIRVLVWPGSSQQPKKSSGYAYYGDEPYSEGTYSQNGAVITDIKQIVNVGHPEWLVNMKGEDDSISLQDDGPAPVFCNYNEYDYNEYAHSWEKDRNRGLSDGEKAGIGVGCSVAFFLLLVLVCMVHRRRKQCRLRCEICCGDAVRKCGPVREVVVRKGGHVREVVVRKCRPVCEYVRAHTPSPPFTGLQVEADLWRRLSMWRKKKDSRLFIVAAGSEDKTPLKDSDPDQTELLHDMHDI